MKNERPQPAPRPHHALDVEDAVIQHSKIRERDVEVADTSEEGKKWADYLEKLSSEDFGKYKV